MENINSTNTFNDIQDDNQIIDLDSLDIRACLLFGRPINIPTLGKVYPLKIKEILEIGITQYFRYVHFLTLKIDEIEDQKNMFWIYFLPDYQNIFIEALAIFLKQNIICDPNEDINKCRFIIGDTNKDNNEYSLNKNNYLSFVNVIKKQHGIEDIKEPGLANDTARKMFEKAKEMRKKYFKNKNADDNGIDILDILSAVSSKHQSINLINIEDLTIYQVINNFRRLNLIDSNKLNLNALLHGATQDEIEIKHWSAKL